MSTIQGIMEILHIAEKLKMEIRHSFLSDGRQESVAEHTWRASLMAMLIGPHLKVAFSMEKLLKMLIIHDLVEAYTGDIPAVDITTTKEEKFRLEEEAARNIRTTLGDTTGEEIYDLWIEFENNKTPEALIGHAIDKLEAQLQHNEADLKTWEEKEKDFVYNRLDSLCTFDKFMKDICDQIKKEAEGKMLDAGEDIESIRQRSSV